MAQKGKPHTLGEEILKPALKIFTNTVLQEYGDKVDTIPFSNYTMRSRIDEMAENVEEQLIGKLRVKKITLQLDESTINRSDTILLAYVRYIDDSQFKEEMLFCEYFQRTTSALDIYNIVVDYFAKWDIPMKSMVACAADGAPSMMGKKNGCLKLLQDSNPSMTVIHCVLHRENLVAKNMSPDLHELLKTVTKCINVIKCHPKAERIFRQLCTDNNKAHNTLLLHNPIRWLSQGESLSRFVELYDVVKEVISDSDLDRLWKPDSKVLLCYLAGIFEKLKHLNMSLQGSNKTLLDAKVAIFGFCGRLRVLRGEVARAEYGSFAHLTGCDVSDTAQSIMVQHLMTLDDEFHRRFADLQQTEFPEWLAQPFITDLTEVQSSLLDELSMLQNDISANALFKKHRQLFWLSTEIEDRYPLLSSTARAMLLPFPTSYLVEAGFSAVNEIVTKKRNSLNLSDRGDLRLKLTGLQPNLKKLVDRHQAQGSH